MAGSVRLFAVAAVCWLAGTVPFAETLIIPQELPTVLSVIYSNIPPILKGTDSRLGLGFRFGPHADFQVQLELGPQMYTQKLGPEEEAKRRRQAARPPVLAVRPAQDPASAAAGSLPSRWLTAWRSGLVNPSQNTLNVVQPLRILNQDTSEDNDVMAQLTSLYNSTENSASAP